REPATPSAKPRPPVWSTTRPAITTTLFTAFRWWWREGGDDAHDHDCACRGGSRAAGSSPGKAHQFEAGPWGREGRGQLRQVPQPRLHPDEFAVPECSAVGRGGH